jgi:hypothetical protein
VEYLGVDLGELFAPAGMIPSDLLYDKRDDDDDAASITPLPPFPLPRGHVNTIVHTHSTQ